MSASPLVLGFAANLLDRAGAETGGEAFAGWNTDPRTRWIALAGEQAILAAGPDGPSVFLRPGAVPVPAEGARVFLGLRDGDPVIAVALDPGAGEALKDDPAFLITDLRSISTGELLPPGELGALAQAKSLLLWHARHRFCAVCGTQTRVAQAGLRRDCSNCGAEHFPRTDPVAIMLVARGEHCLLGRQQRFAPGSYSCLAGFVSPGETIEDAVRREVKEEAGLRVGQVRYLLSQPWPFPSSLMIGCIGTTDEEHIVIDRHELEDARWFTRDEAAAMLQRRHPEGLVTPPPMAIAHHLIRAWVDGATAA